MHRLAALSFSTILLAAGGASLAHADIDFQFGNMTSVELGGNTFSVDLQATWTDWTDQSESIAGFQMNYKTEGLELLSVDSPPDTWTVSNSDELILGFSFTGVVVEPEPQPVSLFTMNFEITQFSGELGIYLVDLMVVDENSDFLSTGLDEYSLVIPAPAGLALLAAGLGGMRRRRTG